MNTKLLLSLTLVVAVLSTGCTMVAPTYSASLDNVQKIKSGDVQSAKVGTFESTKDKGNPNPISIRGSSLNSPYEGSYAKYLAEALKQELTLAGKFSAGASIEITGVLNRNDIDAAMSKGTGDIGARFVVKRDGAVRYDQVKTIRDEWESSFVGAVAIPRAQQRYPTMVQKLLAALYADDAFIQALK
jgi:hypothetical protein